MNTSKLPWTWFIRGIGFAHLSCWWDWLICPLIEDLAFYAQNAEVQNWRFFGLFFGFEKWTGNPGRFPILLCLWMSLLIVKGRLFYLCFKRNWDWGYNWLFLRKSLQSGSRMPDLAGTSNYPNGSFLSPRWYREESGS